jgi:hypothetical protein
MHKKSLNDSILIRALRVKVGNQREMNTLRVKLILEIHPIENATLIGKLSG